LTARARASLASPETTIDALRYLALGPQQLTAKS